MTPLQHISPTRVRCPQCTVTLEMLPPLGQHSRWICEVPGCKRPYQTKDIRNQPIRMYIDPADMEAGLA